MTLQLNSKATPRLRVSIVLPVYNEATHLAACLCAIAAQEEMPYEVIVVDNNSTDATAAIAQTFPFVRIIAEKKQGVVHARTTGFNAARGELIGRIDADTIIPTDWVRMVRQAFVNPEVDAVAGSVAYGNIVWPRLINFADLTIRRYTARVMGREVPLQGANMAMRRSAWLQVRNTLCQTGGMHEDFDLAIHLNWSGCHVIYDESIVAEIGFRQAGVSWFGFIRYIYMSPRTYGIHGVRSGRTMYKIIIFVALVYPVLTAMHRGYNHTQRGFSWRSLLKSSSVPRVNPAEFVDEIA